MLKKLLQKLSTKIESRLVAPQWKHLFYSALAGVIAFVFVTVVSGILQDLGMNFWKVSIVPWTYASSVISHILLIVIALGWPLALLVFVVSWTWYGLYNRTLGELRQLRLELEQLKQEGKATAIGIKEATASNILDCIDREVFLYLTDHATGSNEEQAKLLVDGILQRAFEIWGMEKVYRAAVYLPKKDNPDYLTTEYCDEGVGDKLNWYIGAYDPSVKGPRGIPGSVYIAHASRVDPDIRDDPDFYNLKGVPREKLPHRSAMYAIIHPDDVKKTRGVLCFESESYAFDKKDLTLAELIAIRLAWLLEPQHELVS